MTPSISLHVSVPDFYTPRESSVAPITCGLSEHHNAPRHFFQAEKFRHLLQFRFENNKDGAWDIWHMKGRKIKVTKANYQP